MNCQKIESSIKELKVNSLGRIRNKSRVIDKIHSDHLKSVDSILMDVRIYVNKLSTAHSSTEIIKMVDEFIYQKQIK